MQNYPSWQQFKLYSGHLEILKQIKRKSSAIKKKQNNFTSIKAKDLKQQNLNTPKINDKNKEQHPKFMIRYKSEPNKNQHRKKNALTSPIPLVSQREGNLIKSTLNSKSMPLKEKEMILQNYLLSKRILETKSVFKCQQLKRQFKFHQKISRTMSRSRNRSVNSHDRQQSYRKYQKIANQSQKYTVGQGKNLFKFKLNQILLIKTILPKLPQFLYNLKIKFGKNYYSIRALDYNSLLHQCIHLKFKKFNANNETQVFITIHIMRQTQQNLIGQFKIILQRFMENVQIQTDQQIVKQKFIKQLFKILKGIYPVGTVQIQGMIIKHP